MASLPQGAFAGLARPTSRKTTVVSANAASAILRQLKSRVTLVWRGLPRTARLRAAGGLFVEVATPAASASKDNQAGRYCTKAGSLVGSAALAYQHRHRHLRHAGPNRGETCRLPM